MEKMVSASQPAIDAWRKVNYFVYPESRGYAAIVDAVEGLPTPDKWRRELSSTYRASHQGAHTFRLCCRKLLFPGRCAICKKNNKSLSHCVIGQGTKNATDAGSVPCTTLLKVEKFVDVNRQMALEDGGRLPVEKDVFVFPHETDIDNPRLLHRVSQQHSFPPFEPLLRQEPFSEYFTPEVFAGFFDAAIVIKRDGKKFPQGWTEDKQKFTIRQKKFRDALAESDDATRRYKTSNALTECYLFLIKTHCSKDCESVCKKRKSHINSQTTCEACKLVRGALKKHYVTMMTKTVSDVVNKLFVERKGPFAGCPAVVTDKYVDEHCRVQRVQEAAAPES